MKHFIVPSAIAVALASCSPTQCYQVVNTAPTAENNVTDDLTYSNDDVTVTFDFWSDGGWGGFQIQNDSKSNLVLNLDTTFLIVNGGLDVFFDNTSYAISKSSGSSSTGLAAVNERLNPTYARSKGLTSSARGTLAAAATSTSSNGVQITKKEAHRMVIPPGFASKLHEAEIFDRSLKFCDLQRNPHQRTEKGKTLFKSFTEADSPVNFDFVINYSIGQRTEQLSFSFFVKEVANYKKSEMFVYVREDPCGKTLFEPYREFKDPDRWSFYNKFTAR